MAADLRYFWILLKVNMKAALALRVAYVIRALFSIVTHLVYILVWFVFFKAVPSIGGWQLPHILLAYGIAIAAWGVVSFLAYGFRTLPQQIDYGELDTYLTQPRPVLLNVAMGSSKASGPGETIFGIGVVLYAATLIDVSVPAVLLVMVCASIVFASLILSTATLGFWLRNFHGVAEELYFNFNILASRPGPLFSGWLKIIVLTIIPVSFMTHIPLEWLIEHDMQALLWTLAGTVIFSVLSAWLFGFGLRYYESGNRFGVRG